MALYDLESFMTDLETIVKANMQAYITATNTEKGDTLLPDFEADSYHVWDISDIPPYALSFLQFIGIGPKLGATNPGYAHSVDYGVRLTCFILDNGEGTMGQMKVRMDRILLQIVQEKLVNKLTNLNMAVTNMDAALLQTQAGTVYDTASILISVTFAF